MDLDRYDQRYGLHATELDLLERVFYHNKLRFIRRFVGLDPASPMPDLGCGNGIFVDYLRRRGDTDVAGYDPYSAAHADTGVLERRYRLVLSSDVVEHMPSPAEHLERACDQVTDGGYRYLQTPDAHHIDLASAAPASCRSPGPTAPTSTPGSRSSTCRPSTGTWTATAGWAPSTSRSGGRRCGGRGSGAGADGRVRQPHRRGPAHLPPGRLSIDPTRRNDAGTKVMDHPAP